MSRLSLMLISRCMAQPMELRVSSSLQALDRSVAELMAVANDAALVVGDRSRAMKAAAPGSHDAHCGLWLMPQMVVDLRPALRKWRVLTFMSLRLMI